MNPYIYTQRATENGESLLALCAGIGLELQNLNTQDVTAVDIAPQYLEQVHRHCPQAKLVESDVTEYIKKAETNSVDVISFIDGLEHLSKEDGLVCLKECKRVARKQVLVFTQDGYLKNEPHNAWGIEGADEYQTHKSGWSILELKDMGYDLLNAVGSISQHNEPYTAIMLSYTKDK